jgi:hypothetical protein
MGGPCKTHGQRISHAQVVLPHLTHESSWPAPERVQVQVLYLHQVVCLEFIRCSGVVTL